MGLPSSPIKIWGKSVHGFLSYDRTDKQTDKQRCQLYSEYRLELGINCYLEVQKNLTTFYKDVEFLLSARNVLRETARSLHCVHFFTLPFL